MKPENIFLLAIVGIGLWYLSTQTAEAKTPMQKLVDAKKIQASFDAARFEQPELRTAQTGTF